MTYALFLQLEGDDDSSHIADRIVRVAHLDEDEDIGLMKRRFEHAMSALRTSSFDFFPNELDT